MSNVPPANSDPETKLTVPETTGPAPTDTDEEPQNALTQKFTDKEWAALKEFRVRAVQDSSFSAHAQLIILSASAPGYPRKGI